jgi:3',5'-cyclic AMP phosphodiesterase CpdA
LDAHVVLANHFPLEGKKCRTSLQRNQALFELLRTHPQIKLYLHGHDHQHRIVDLREKKLPIAVDAGSATLKTQGSWVLMDCEENGCRVTSFLWDREGSSWAQAPHSTSFTW